MELSGAISGYGTLTPLTQAESLDLKQFYLPYHVEILLTPSIVDQP